MSEIIDVAHLAPVRYQPRRGNGLRTGYASLTTPVRLRDVTAAEMPVVGRLGDGVRVHAHEGHLWAPVFGDEAGALIAGHGRAMTMADAARDLSLSGSLLMRSPVLALHQGACIAGRPEPGKVARVAEDGRDRAQADLAAFVDGHVRTRGQVTFFRVRGPLFHLAYRDDGLQFRFSPSPFAMDTTTLNVTPSRVLPAWEVLKARGERGTSPPPTVGLTGIDVAEGDDDVSLYACIAVETVTGAARYMARHTGCAGTAAALLEGAEALEGHRSRAILGAIRQDEAADVLEATCDLARATIAARREASLGAAADISRTLAYAEGIFLPALAATPTPEDEEALVGMAP